MAITTALTTTLFRGMGVSFEEIDVSNNAEARASMSVSQFILKEIRNLKVETLDFNIQN
jgi:hypothetical protein